MINYPYTTSDRETQLLHSIEHLREERDRAIDRLTDLEDKISFLNYTDPMIFAFSKLGLDPMGCRMMSYIWSRKFVTKQQLYTLAYELEETNNSPVSLHAVSVHMSHARTKLKKYQVSLTRVGNQGWYFDDENRHRLQSLMEH